MPYGSLLADVVQSSASGTPPQFNDTSGTQVGTLCRAWVNFNGTLSSPITPRASFNVTSVTKNATGDFTITFTNAMPDANYAVTGCAQYSTVGGSQAVVAVKSTTTPYTTTSINVVGFRSDLATFNDFTAMNVAIFR
jgi:hypothetical protein